MSVLYSPSAYSQGIGSGFYFPDDKNAPKDSFLVSDEDHAQAMNLPYGYTYDFTKDAVLIITPPNTDFLLKNAKQSKAYFLQQKYKEAINADIEYTSLDKTTAIYQADTQSIQNLQNLLIAFSSFTDMLPEGFYWVAADNSHVSFAYHDMQLLGKEIALRGIEAFINLQDKKALIDKLTEIAEVEAIEW